jgi:hypothetical protein
MSRQGAEDQECGIFFLPLSHLLQEAPRRGKRDCEKIQIKERSKQLELEQQKPKSINNNKKQQKTTTSNNLSLSVSLSLSLYPSPISVRHMKFGIGMLLALVATNQLVAAAPVLSTGTQRMPRPCTYST